MSSKRSLTVVDVDTKKKTTKKIAATKAVQTKAAKKPSTTKPGVKKTTTKKAAVKKAAKKVTRRSPVAKSKANKTTAKAISQQELTGLKREPLGHLLMEQHLREAGFHGGVSTDKTLLDSYSTDESIFAVRPQVVLQPKHQRDVETAVKVIAAHTAKFPSLSLTPRAAGTGLSGGSLTDSIVVDVCAHMKKIGEVVPNKDGATIKVEPGTMWRDVEKKLKAHDVYIPSFPASKDLCSIGGAVGNNAAGPDSLRYGHTASWVQSLDITLHDGNTYTVTPLTYKEFKTLTKKKHALAKVAKEVFSLIEKNQTEINKAQPKTKKNSAATPFGM